MVTVKMVTEINPLVMIGRLFFFGLLTLHVYTRDGLSALPWYAKAGWLLIIIVAAMPGRQATRFILKEPPE